MLIKSFFTNSFGILCSRLLGFLRDVLTASILGANIYSDIFFVAFKLPNLFRRIFAEGAFTQAYLPAFTQATKKGIFAVRTFFSFFGFVLVTTLLVMITAPYLTKLIAYGFDEQTIALASPLVKINFWYLLLIYMVTFISAMLHYKGHFLTTAFSTALLNIGMISALLLSEPADPHQTAINLSFGVLFGGVLQLITHLIAMKKFHLTKIFFGSIKKIKTKPKNEDRFYKNFFHGVLGGSTAQISSFIDTWLASFLVSGSISYLFYANRIFQLPLAVFAIALSMAIFPRITRAIKNTDEAGALVLLKKGFWVITILLTLAMVGGMMLSYEICWLLFERGAFRSSDTAQTSFVLYMYLMGLLPFGVAKIFSLWLYAHNRQAKAAFISVISLSVNIILAIILINYLQAAGLALASSLGAFVLLFLTIKEFGFKRFLAIIKSKMVLLLLGLVALEVIILHIFKELISGYL